MDTDPGETSDSELEHIRAAAQKKALQEISSLPKGVQLSQTALNQKFLEHIAVYALFNIEIV